MADDNIDKALPNVEQTIKVPGEEEIAAAETEVTEDIKNETSLKSEKIDLNVIYEDEDLIVIDKPAGIVMHPGAGNKSGTIVNALINHCGNSLKFVGDSQRPGIVHRIDKDTSGLVVVAKNDFSHQHLSLQFADHSISREYMAICWGSIKPASGKISVSYTHLTLPTKA